MTELILIRHGETDWNRELRFQGQIDVPLNPVGHEQARRLGARLAGEAAHWLVCSDLTRTRQTALPISRENRQLVAPEPVLSSALREQKFGSLDGMSVAEIQSRHPDAWEQWTRFDADYAFEGGESARQFHCRVMAAVRSLALAHPKQILIVVTHGGVLDMIYRTARALPLSGPRQSEIPNAGLNRVRLDADTVEILSWADTRHLLDMPAQPVYDQASLAEPTAALD